MTILWIDFETRSKCDLPSRGVYNYAQDLSTEVLCMSYAFDDDEVVTWMPGQPFPAVVANHTGQIRAHNAAFERLIFWFVLCPDHKIPEFKLEQFYCTAAQARANCAPGSLEDVGRFAGASMKKDHRGSQLIRLLSVPQADGFFRQDQTLMAEMIQYCEQDVRAMRAISKGMRDLSTDELTDYHVNERVNDRGVRVDVELCNAAIRYATEELDEIQQIVREVTDGAITSVRSPKMRQWVLDRVGPQALELMTVYKDGEAKYSIDKSVRGNLLILAGENPDEVPPDVAEVIQCADDLWASSVAKFQRAANLADRDDGRVRGAFVFSGGSATGRASSFGLQVHNFPRKCAKEPELVRAAMTQGGEIVPQYGKRVTDVLKQMLRPALLAEEGNMLVVADWSSIEARVNPWLSGRGDDKLEIFRNGGDVYKVNASATFRVPVADVTGDQRQVGKVQELACLAEDTVVLTDNGYKVITAVTINDKLWDGEEWVRHQGLVNRGRQQVTDVGGVYATPDHLFLVANKWKEAQQLVSNESLLYQALETGSASLPSSVLNMALQAAFRSSAHNALATQRRIASPFQTSVKAHLLAAMRALKKLRVFGVKRFLNTPKLAPMMPIVDGFSTAYPRVKIAATIQKIAGIPTMARGASHYINLGIPIRRRFYVTLCRLTDGICRIWNLIGLMLTRATNPAICASFLTKLTTETNGPCKSYKGALMNWRNVYDIAHAGPRNRFMVMSGKGPLIVHNCGFAGGVGAFAAMGRIYGLLLPEPEAKRMVDGWRRANPWAMPFWESLERAYTAAMRYKGKEFTAGRITYLFDGVHLWYALPSGRILCYPYARLEEDGVTYAKAAWKPAADAKEWPRARLWRGLACENVTQATANDILRHALRTLDGWGFEPVLHVHDEIVLETTDPEATEQAMQRAMCTPPAWAAGLPLGIETHSMIRYGKG